MLVLVLMLVAVMSLLLGSAALLSRGALSRVAHYRLAREARAAALEAMFQEWAPLAGTTNAWHAAAHFASLFPAAERPSVTDSGWIEPRWFPAGDAPPERGLRDAESRVNLNTADDALLQRVLRAGGGVDAGAAKALATAVRQWRGDDAEVERPPGAVGADAFPGDVEGVYTRAGVPWAPRGTPLNSLETLRLLPGGQDLDLQGLSRVATVWGAGPVNLHTASPEVLEIVLAVASEPGEDAARARLLERLAQARREGRVATALTPEALSGMIGSGGRFEASAAETALITRLVQQRRVGVMSRVFKGTAVGQSAPHAVSGRRQTVRIAFAWDRELGQAVYWRED